MLRMYVYSSYMCTTRSCVFASVFIAYENVDDECQVCNWMDRSTGIACRAICSPAKRHDSYLREFPNQEGIYFYCNLLSEMEIFMLFALHTSALRPGRAKYR